MLSCSAFGTFRRALRSPLCTPQKRILKIIWTQKRQARKSDLDYKVNAHKRKEAKTAGIDDADVREKNKARIEREAADLYRELQSRLRAAAHGDPKTEAEIRQEAAHELALQLRRDRKRAREDCKRLVKAYLKLIANGQGLARFYCQLGQPGVDLRDKERQLAFLQDQRLGELAIAVLFEEVRCLIEGESGATSRLRASGRQRCVSLCVSVCCENVRDPQSLVSNHTPSL